MTAALADWNVGVLLFRESGIWIAQCLHYDIAAQGASPMEALQRLQNSFVAHVLVGIQDDQLVLLGDIPPAPKQYWPPVLADREEITERVPIVPPKG